MKKIFLLLLLAAQAVAIEPQCCFTVQANGADFAVLHHANGGDDTVMVDGDTYTLGDLDTVSMSMFGCVENDNQCVVVFQAWYYSPSEHACLYPTMTSMQSVAPGCSGLYARAVTYCFQNGGGPVVNSWIINSWCNCLD